ncbi:uncharacterized protein N7443_001882, partial [Penicillium atrosanguineum]|uniref:uncharacterized protein n=1 Tax=Penicillium atrosanguineum TaxID=1132637 RepID=UPI0023887EAC
MPIPTRSGSLREPRKPLQTSNIARPLNPASSNGYPKSSRPANDITRAPSSSSPADGIAKDNGGSNQGRTLLPQRSGNLTRDNGSGLSRTRVQPPENKLAQRRDISPTREPQTAGGEKQGPVTTTTKASVPTRRQSLIRPSTSRLASATKPNVSSFGKGPVPTFRPPSPRKAPLRSPTQSAYTPRAPSPKKTDMPPPQRPARSASLRQPPRTGPAPSVAVRGHARHRSQVVPSNVKPIQPDPTPGAQKPRAQFSTFQQNYSPKKPTKPPTPTPVAVPEPGNLLIPTSWPDIAALQTELLQLSLFHSNSLQRHNDWKAESESHLRSKYDGVAGQYRSMLGDEKMRQSQLNAQALSSWLQNCHDHRGPLDFPGQIQTLSQILQEISDLVTSGMSGRYSHAVETFELWFEQAKLVRHDREYSEDGIMFIDPLDQAWKEEMHALQAKLELCQRQLQSLDILGFGEVERLEHSALTRVSQSLVESTQLMIYEINAMRTLEAELVRSEREAVRQLVQKLPSTRNVGVLRVGIWNR